MSGDLIRLERRVHYGNAGLFKNSARPDDDEYLFKPENTRDLWAHALQITDRYGFDLFFDESGNAVLQSRNLPHQIVDLDATLGGAPTLKTHPSAHAGTYIEYTGPVATVSKTVAAARIDLSVPRGASLGTWSYTIRRASDNGIVATGTINPDSGTGSVDTYFYDYRATADGTNATVTTLFSGYFGSYIVQLASSGGSGGTVRRLDCLLLYHTDPVTPLLPSVLSTARNALDVDGQATMNDFRNFVIVVGARRAIVTDSAKFNSSEINPGTEFVVQAASNPASVLDPADPSYIGGTKEAIIYDSGVTDDDFAAYLARTFIYKYQAPRPAATIRHTLLPGLQLRDPVYALEDTYQTIAGQQVLFVSGLRHSLSERAATTEITTTSYQDFPSYQPREDIDIDANFGGSPVANLRVRYTSVTGETRTNLMPGEEYVSGPADIVEYSAVSVTAGSPDYLDMSSGKAWPPVPGTVFLRPGVSGATGASSLTTTQDVTIPHGGSGGFTLPLPNMQTITSVVLTFYASGRSGSVALTSRTRTLSSTRPTPDNDTERFYYQVNSDGTLAIYSVPSVSRQHHPTRVFQVEVQWTQSSNYSAKDWLTNTPYHHFFNVDHRTSGTGAKRIHLPWKQGDNTTPFQRNTAVTSYDVKYRRLGPVDGSNNFLDPYGGTSPFYDPYTSELGNLVTISMDLLVSGTYRMSIRNVADDTVVAWITEPTADPDDPEQHWTYMNAAAGRSFVWDGVDAVGRWNERQSYDYSVGAHGAFETEERPVIGRGFYVWNQEQGATGGYAPLALIAGTRDATTGLPDFGQGTYAVWYLKIEATNDRLRAKDGAGGTGIRILDSTALDPTMHAAAIQVTGTSTGATAGSATTNGTLTDAGKSWRTNQWRGYQVRITSGTGAGQVRKIVSNTATVLTVNGSWTAPTASGYRIESTAALVYTHLPAPNRVELSVSDWFNASSYNETSPPTTDTGNWQADPTTDAIINNQKPVRVRYKLSQRPGVQWAAAGTTDKSSVRVLRVAHIKASIFDQIVVYDGEYFPGSTVEKKAVVNRRLSNDSHTFVFEDSDFVRGSSFKQVTAGVGDEWVFLPKSCRKQFRGDHEEALEFGNYLQLEEVPKWDDSRKLTAPRSRFQLAFLNYLFYLSVYTQDRSGRFAWGLDRRWIDRSKIIKNAYADWWDPAATPGTAASSSTFREEWPIDPNTQHRRTIIVRQWADEGVASGNSWRTAQRTLWGMATNSIADQLLRHKWKDHEPTSTTINGVSYTAGNFPDLKQDDWSHWHSLYADLPLNWRTGLGAVLHASQRQLGDTSAGSALGRWTWEPGPLWIPNVVRDFHPYYFVPPMMDKDGTVKYRTSYIYGQVDSRGYKNDATNTNQGDDTAAAPVWSSPTLDATESFSTGTGSKKRFWPGFQVDLQNGQMKGVFPGKTNFLNYVRQDEMMHYEDYRGIWSRGPRPQEAPRKVTPAGPYYVNPFEYGPVTIEYGYQPNKANSSGRVSNFYPIYRATVNAWFRMTFRYQYTWESGSLFPVDLAGVEQLWAMNPARTRFANPNQLSAVRFDDGAWVGWKDDVATANDAAAGYKLYYQFGSGLSAILHATTHLFQSRFMPVAVGPELRTPGGTRVSQDMIFHLVLVPERRDQAV
jgi:hypothetical protein